MTDVAGWPARLLTGLTATALMAPLVAVPHVRDLAVRDVLQSAGWAAPMVLPQPPSFQTAPDPPDPEVGPPPSAGSSGGSRASGTGWGTYGTGGGAGPGTRPGPPTAGTGAPAPPAPPVPPALPWTAPAPTQPMTAVATSTAPRLGPVLHVTLRVAPGAAVTLPAGVGRPHILCDGTTAPDAEYWLDSSSSTNTQVHRDDGGTVYDFYYRNVTGQYLQRKRCS